MQGDDNSARQQQFDLMVSRDVLQHSMVYSHALGYLFFLFFIINTSVYLDKVQQ